MSSFIAASLRLNETAQVLKIRVIFIYLPTASPVRNTHIVIHRLTEGVDATGASDRRRGSAPLVSSLLRRGRT